jgi:type I restriction enzyme S subunit
MFYKETNFKEAPIGKIPKEWDVTNLESIAKISSGNTAPQDEKYFRNGKYPFIRVQHLTELQEQKYPVKCDYINDYAVSDLRLKKFKKGSIIFPKSGESIKLEKRAILKEDSYVVNHLAVIESFDKNADNLFLFYYLCTVKTSNYLTKTTMPSLNLSTISDFLIPLPSLQEQRKIAEVLSTIDEAIQKTNEIIAKTERLKKGLMQELLTKGIGHKEFKDTEIGRIPKEWEVVKLGEIGTFQYGITASAKEEDTGVKFLRITDIRDDGTINWSEVPFCEISVSELSKYMLKVGDVLFARIGATTGKTCYINQEIRGVFGSYLIRFLPDANSQIDTKFLHLFTQSEMYWLQVNRIKGGQLKKGLNTQLLKEIKILLPPLEEQQKIAQVLSTVGKKLEIERNEKAKLERIKQGLMNLLLTGKIRIKVN